MSNARHTAAKETAMNTLSTINRTNDFGLTDTARIDEETDGTFTVVVIRRFLSGNYITEVVGNYKHAISAGAAAAQALNFHR